MLGKGCGSKEKSGGGHSPTGKGNRKEPKNAKCTAPSEKQRDVLLPPSQPPQAHTHAHHTSHLDTWSLTSSHSINSDSSSPHLFSRKLYIQIFANCGCRGLLPFPSRSINCLLVYFLELRLHFLFQAPYPSESSSLFSPHWLRINSNFSSPLLYYTIGT